MDFFKEAEREYERAREKYPPFHSTHEGYAVLKEEMEELNDGLERLWEMVKANKGTSIWDGNPAMVRECVQIAAMAYAFVRDLGGIEEL